MRIDLSSRPTLACVAGTVLVFLLVFIDRARRRPPYSLARVCPRNFSLRPRNKKPARYGQPRGEMRGPKIRLRLQASYVGYPTLMSPV